MPEVPQKVRLLSIDAFRGLTIAGMILVNDPGTWSAIYPPLEHAEWNGWTPTDLVFPFFLFLVGTSMVFSFSSRRERGSTRRELLRHTLRRSLYIYGIGLALHLYPFTLRRIEHVRVMGVLGRIALCYFVGSLIYLYCSRRVRAVIIAAILVGYWAVMRFVPVPGFGAGDLSPFGNLAAYIDRLVLGGHLWKPMWDPEGLLSSVPAVGTLLLGTFCGEWLREPRAASTRAYGLLVAGVVGLVVGELVHPYFPINKNLWTSTFVIFTAGFASVLLAFFYWVIDVRGVRGWVMPMEVFGANAILSYAVATFVSKQMDITSVGGHPIQDIVYRRVFAHLAAPQTSSLFFAIVFTITIWLIMLVFYRKKIFLKV
jgi:predicted acyltransferase